MSGEDERPRHADVPAAAGRRRVGGGRLYEGNARFYAAFLRARHLRPQPGLTVETCADILSAVADGLAARALTARGGQVVEHEHRRSHLGTVTLALVLACLERDDEAGGRTLEEAVVAMLCGPSPGAGATGPGLTPAERGPAGR